MYRIIICGEVGVIKINSFDEVLMLLCFYVGGDKSVCGFDYCEIFLIVEVIDLEIGEFIVDFIGGKYFVILSVEYVY